MKEHWFRLQLLTVIVLVVAGAAFGILNARQHPFCFYEVAPANGAALYTGHGYPIPFVFRPVNPSPTDLEIAELRIIPSNIVSAIILDATIALSAFVIAGLVFEWIGRKRNLRSGTLRFHLLTMLVSYIFVSWMLYQNLAVRDSYSVNMWTDNQKFKIIVKGSGFPFVYQELCSNPLHPVNKTIVSNLLLNVIVTFVLMILIATVIELVLRKDSLRKA